MTHDRRQRMVSEQLKRRDVIDPQVLAAFGLVPREAFVSHELDHRAYDDQALPIGQGQTISQPYVVALTAQALRLRGVERVLEIGTGSGYAAAILGLLAREVHTVERLPELAHAAAARLAELGYDRVQVHVGDGTLGWPASAPYDAIAVAAAAPRVPPALRDQLAIGGRLVVPIGSEHGQQLVRITRRSERDYDRDDLGAVRFVPLVGAQGFTPASKR
ncbi:MAG TPA: protein-L-isoaspartate(D-aspartate) O-methyltransferase [Kofleriaceae bacterium]|nr:protein-L-isoaspartate(D-aspartate) O-methyltransferase [Kofleriaceae bacterium]